VLFYVPAVLGALLECQRDNGDSAPILRTILGGASNVPAAMIADAETTFGATVINLFGQTELSPVLSATRPGDSRDDQLATVGRPLPHVDCKIVDPVTTRPSRSGSRAKSVHADTSSSSPICTIRTPHHVRSTTTDSSTPATSGRWTPAVI